MGALLQDIRYGARLLRSHMGFTVVAVLTLALGIGANTAIFSILYAVAWRPLPFRDAERLVIVWETDANRGVDRGVASPAEYLDWKEQNDVFEKMGAWRLWFHTLTGAGEPEQVWGVQATTGFFDLLGVKPALGRTFVPEDGIPGHEQVVILSDGIWHRHFGADPKVLGRSINLDGKLYTVIGVLQPDFSLLGTSQQFELWVPFAWDRAQLDRSEHTVIVFARLKPGVTLQHANVEMKAINERLRRAYPGPDERLGVQVRNLHDDLTVHVKPALGLLLGAVGFVLLIACVNVANLLLARSATREREMATRAVLGASRMRLVRQLLTESVLLSVLGGALGVLLAYLGVKALLGVLPPVGSYGDVPHRDWIGLNGPVLGFTLLLSAGAGILFGLAPALHVAGKELHEAIKEGGRGATSRRGRMLRSGLVVAELALSLVLLVGAGLLIESFVRLLMVNPGFNPDHVITMQVYLPPAHYATPASIRSFYDEVLQKTSALPGVKEAGAINFLPLTAWRDYNDFDIEGKPAPPPGEEFTAQYRVVDTNYFRAMEIPLLRGRGFTTGDGAEAPGVTLVNEALVKKYWSQSDPIGQRIRMHEEASAAPYRPAIREDWLTIVGVAGDIHDWQWGDEKVAVVYLPAEQDPSRIMRIVARASGDPLKLAPEIRESILKVDPNQPVTDVKTMEDLVSEAMAQRRATMVLLATFAGLAMVLAAVGVYGVFAYSVTQRRHEIGIRMAIGAQPGDVMKLIMGQALALAALGIGIGGAASLTLGRWLASQLYGVKVTDPATYLGMSVMLLVVALVACWIPARRAMRMDPVKALRYE